MVLDNIMSMLQKNVPEMNFGEHIDKVRTRVIQGMPTRQAIPDSPRTLVAYVYSYDVI